MNIINANNDPMGGTPRIPVMFRSEFARDCGIVRTVLAPWIVSWKEEPNYLLGEGKLIEVPDRLVTMELRVDNFTRNIKQICWFLDHIDDMHVVVQSMAYAEDYTGERKWEVDYRLISEDTVPDNSTLSILLRHLAESVISSNHEIGYFTGCAEAINKAWRLLGRQVMPDNNEEP